MEVMVRYGADAADVARKVGRIMLKYRPIAPKPAVSGAALPAGPVEPKSAGGRGKRKVAAVRDGRRGRKSCRRSAAAYSCAPQEFKYGGDDVSPPRPVVTLPLMPVTPERKEEAPSDGAVTSPSSSSEGHGAAGFFSWPPQKRANSNTTSSSSGSSSVVVAPRPVRPVGSWVTVECVTDAWRDQGAAPALPMSLAGDACPCFVSDAAGGRVTWTNAAYRKMVVGPEEGALGEEEVMRVALVTRGLVPAEDEGVTCFTCRVRVRYACRGRGNGRASLAVPCDVWRLAGGALAWRLDVKAALSLGLGS